MTTGELLVVRGGDEAAGHARTGRRSKTVDVVTKEATVSFKERTDVTAVPAMGVVAETMVALVLAAEAQRKFGGDSLDEFVRNADVVPQLARLAVVGVAADQHLVLVGLMGSGKTTVARIARRPPRSARDRHRRSDRERARDAPCGRSSPTTARRRSARSRPTALLEALGDPEPSRDRRRGRRRAARREP